jgi:hypothetical protein
MGVYVTNVHLGPTRAFQVQLELCSACKVAWIDKHLGLSRPRRRGAHEVFMPDARLTPKDVDELQTLRAWRNANRNAR